MTSAPVRDQLSDHLRTPQNAALVLIDYQPSQLAAVVHSTVNVASGRGKPTLPELADDMPLDRTTVNSSEDVSFAEAVRTAGHRKLMFLAL
jgi:hypothetical protein